MGYTILVIIIAVVAFLIGRRTAAGRRSQQLGQAWQQGYDAATAYWRTGAGAQASEPDAAPGPSAPAGSTQPAPGHPHAHAGSPPAPAPGQHPAPAARDQQSPQPAQTPPTPAPARLPFLAPASGGGQVSDRVRAIEFGPQRTSAAPSTPVRPTLSARERELRNVNITLYVAALLLVAAGALFLSFALAPVAKLVGLCVVAAAFYAAGLIVHRVQPNLRPAAAAFTGTGLALLPLCALATYNTLHTSPTGIWLGYSVVGTLAFGFASLRLHSRVLAWLAVLILISTAMSGGAVLQQGVLVYLLALLVLAVAMLLLVIGSPAVRASQFHQALSSSYRLLPPLVFLASLVMLDELSSREFFWIFLPLSAFYVLSTRLEERHRLWNLAAARVFFLLAVLFGLDYAQTDPRVILVLLAALLAAQAALVQHFAAAYERVFGASQTWRVAERMVLWAGAWLALAAGYARDAHSAHGTWWLTLLVIPALLVLLGWLAGNGGTVVEAGWLFGFALLALAENWQDAWSPLPALVLGVAGLGAVVRRQPDSLALLGAQLRWVLLLAVGAKSAQLLQFLFAPASDRGVASAAMVGIWAAAAGMLVYSARNAGHAERTAVANLHWRIRVTASLLVMVVFALALRLQGELSFGAHFLGVTAGSWSVLVLIGSVLATAWVAWRCLPTSGGAMDAFVHAPVLGALCGYFVLALRTDFWWLAPLVAAANIVFLIAALPRCTAAGWRITHAALAQIQLSVAAWWSVEHFELDLHGQFCVLLLSVVLPQAARLVLSRSRGAAVPGELRVLGLGILVGLPLLLLAYAVGPQTDRGTVLLSLLLWLGYALLAHWAFGAGPYRQWLLLPVSLAVAALAIVPAATFGSTTGWVRAGWWGATAAMWLLAAQAVVALGLEWTYRRQQGHQGIRLAALLVPLVLMLGYQPELRWLALVFLIGAAGSILLVHTRQMGLYSAAAALLLLGAADTGLQALRSGTMVSERSLDLSWALLGGALVLLVLALLHGRFQEPVPHYPRHWQKSADAGGQAARIYYAAMLASGFTAGAVAHLLHRGPLPLLGGALVLVLALLVARLHELPRAWRQHGTDAVVVAAALVALRCYGVLVEPLGASAALLYLAVVAAGIGLRHWAPQRALGRGWLIAGAALGSAAELASVLDAGTLTQMLVLLFFAGLLALGLTQGERLLTRWAAVAITAAVVWFLRNYAFVLLVLVAIALIVLALSRLVRVENRRN